MIPRVGSVSLSVPRVGRGLGTKQDGLDKKTKAWLRRPAVWKPSTQGKGGDWHLTGKGFKIVGAAVLEALHTSFPKGQP